MKKLLLMCAFVMGISAVSFAQRQQRSPAEMTDRLKTQLTGITDDQAAKITAIYTVQAKSYDSLRTAMGDGADMRAMMTKRAPITDANNARIKAILTPDQAAAFQKMLDERAAAMKARMQGGN